MAVSKQKAFPRGGHAVKKSTNLATDQKENVKGTKKKKDRDLFNVSSSNNAVFTSKKKSKKSKKKSETDDDNSGLRLKIVEPLTYDKLTDGFKVLARISEIHDLDLKLSLPGRLVAFVPITKISQPYTDALKKVAQDPKQAEILGLRPLNEIFSVGQLVSCSVDSVDKAENDFYKVSATLNPHKVNENMNVCKNATVMAAVKAVEDHGYVMDIGKSNLKAFLPLKKAGRNFNPSLGQVLPCVITKLDNSVAVLSCEPSKLASNVISDLSSLTVHNIYPGLVLEAKVLNNLKHGFALKFGDFEGYVNVSHQGNEEDPEVGQDVKATVLYVIPTVNHIFLSMQPDLAFGVPVQPLDSKAHKIGDLVKNCKVVEADERGLTLDIENDTGIVPVRHLNEGQKKDIKAKLNTAVTARILQYDYFEQIFVCTMQKSLLEQNILKLGHLKPGQRLTVKAKKFTATGLIVEVGRNLDGFIPHLHLSDVPLKHPEKKFAIGDSLKVRVLKVNAEKKRLHLTHKRLLIETDFELVDSFDPKFVGKITEGVVVQTTNEGVLLELFNDICGWVPKSKISLEPVEYPEKLFFLGQVLKTKVLDVQPSARRMSLTLILSEEKMAPLGTKEKKATENIKKGFVYENLKVTDVNPEGLEVQVGNVKAIIPKNHLTDLVGMADLLLSSYQVNDTIEKALCFEKDVLPVLTMKASIMNYEHASMTLDDLHVGQVIPGIVSNIKPYGVFVKLPIWKMRKSSALIPLRHLSDTFVEDPKDHVELHQTLYGKILEKNDKEGKLTMSSKAKVVSDGVIQGSVDLVVNLFNDLEKARSLCRNRDLLLVKVGQAVNSVVKNVSQFGVETLINGRIRGIITMSTLELDGLDMPEKGQIVAGVITYVDFKFGVVELNVHPDVVKKAVLMKAKKIPNEGQKVKASCVLKRSELHLATMVIKSPHQFQGHLIHVPTRYHLNEPIGFGDLYSLYEVYNITVKAVIENKHIIGLLEKHDRGVMQKRARKISNSEAEVKTKKARLDSTSSATSVQEEVKAEPENEDVDPGWDKDFNPWGTGPISAKSAEMSESKIDAANDAPAESKKAKTHLSKKEKKELDRLEELAIKRAEQRIVEGQDLPPESVDEFDKLVLSSPDSSLCWIQYMAYHVDKQEFGLAREVVKRALGKINFREENERFNVYMAWFNLENQFGTEEEADKVLKEAVQCNDEFKVYEKVASVYMSSEKHDKAERIYKILARKFNKEMQVWILLGQFYFKTNNLKEARFTLQRSLQNLKKTSEIVAVTSKFAQFEFLHGESERGKTIFENIIRDFPSRIDQWSVYADMVIKKGEIEAARDIFERMINLGLGPKKMKSLFKKYWEFEQSHGDSSRVDQVRKKALEYLERQNVKIDDTEDVMEQMDD